MPQEFALLQAFGKGGRLEQRSRITVTRSRKYPDLVCELGATRLALPEDGYRETLLAAAASGSRNHAWVPSGFSFNSTTVTSPRFDGQHQQPAIAALLSHVDQNRLRVTSNPYERPPTAARRCGLFPRDPWHEWSSRSRFSNTARSRCFTPAGCATNVAKLTSPKKGMCSGRV